MYRLVYRITKRDERSLVRALRREGAENFYVEKNRDGLFLHFFSMYPQSPDVLHGLVPESVQESRDNSWNDLWASEYKGHELTGDIYVRASGAPLPEKKYRHVIEIDPGKSFGDGHHPTTRLCAEILQEYLEGEGFARGLNMIDVGTGSGILAMAAYMLGVRDIELFDIDEKSVAASSVNLKLNNIRGILPFAADIYSFRFGRPYDIITANLLTSLIEDSVEKMSHALSDRGVMVLSGISSKWTGTARRLFRRNNLRILIHKKLEGWNGFLVKRR